MPPSVPSPCTLASPAAAASGAAQRFVAHRRQGARALRLLAVHGGHLDRRHKLAACVDG